MASIATSSDPDSLYVQDCRQVQSNTHAIQTLTGQISKLVANLHGLSDFAQCRGKVDEAVQQASETQKILARIREYQRAATDPVEKNNRRMMYRKLSDNLAVTARVLEDVVRRYQAEDAKRPPLPTSASASAVKASGGPDAAGGEEHLPLVDTGSLVKDLEQPTEVLEQDLSNEKGTALRRVDEDMRCLQKIYTDLATAVEESQCTFESLETHMASAAADVERGRLEIQALRLPIGRKLKEKGVLIGGVLLGIFVVSSYLGS